MVKKRKWDDDLSSASEDSNPALGESYPRNMAIKLALSHEDVHGVDKAWQELAGREVHYGDIAMADEIGTDDHWEVHRSSKYIRTITSRPGDYSLSYL